LKRTIGLKSIIGLSKSKSASNLQLIVHVQDEHDYRFEVKNTKVRDELVSVILKTADAGSSIRVYSIPEGKNLKDFAATKRDILKGT